MIDVTERIQDPRAARPGDVQHELAALRSHSPVPKPIGRTRSRSPRNRALRRPGRCRRASLPSREKIRYGPAGHRLHSASLNDRNARVCSTETCLGQPRYRVTSGSLAYVRKMASTSAARGRWRTRRAVSTRSKAVSKERQACTRSSAPQSPPSPQTRCPACSACSTVYQSHGDRCRNPLATSGACRRAWSCRTCSRTPCRRTPPSAPRRR